MTSPSPWLIVGLGNPGAQYAQTRHNVGHHVINVLSQRTQSSLVGHRSRTHIADTRLGTLPGGIPGPRVILATSDSYMNTSGGPIGALARFLNISPGQLLVIHDDLDLPSHQLRLKYGGGEGGHNGLKSLTQVLGTPNYHRLRIGIGRPPGHQDAADFVLAPIPLKERPEWEVLYEEAADVVEDIVTTSFADAQQRLHTRN